MDDADCKLDDNKAQCMEDAISGFPFFLLINIILIGVLLYYKSAMFYIATWVLQVLSIEMHLHLNIFYWHLMENII